jgi:hypothetical protein
MIVYKSFAILILLQIPIMIHGQVVNDSRLEKMFSIGLSKSVFTTPDNGLSIENTFPFIPDIRAEIFLRRNKIELGYVRYHTLYDIRFDPGDIETRKFHLFEVLYRKHTYLSNGRFIVSYGTGPALRRLNELVTVGIVKHGSGGGCWYEILSERIFTNSIGLILAADLRCDFSKRLFVKTGISYNAFIGSYNQARMDLVVGYYFGRRA